MHAGKLSRQKTKQKALCGFCGKLCGKLLWETLWKTFVVNFSLLCQVAAANAALPVLKNFCREVPPLIRTLLFILFWVP